MTCGISFEITLLQVLQQALHTFLQALNKALRVQQKVYQLLSMTKCKKLQVWVWVIDCTTVTISQILPSCDFQWLSHLPVTVWYYIRLHDRGTLKYLWGLFWKNADSFIFPFVAPSSPWLCVKEGRKVSSEITSWTTNPGFGCQWSVGSPLSPK